MNKPAGPIFMAFVTFFVGLVVVGALLAIILLPGAL